MKSLVVILGLLLAAIAASMIDAQPNNGSSVVDGPTHDGQDITCELPPAQQMKNIGSKLDGAGMCIWADEYVTTSEGDVKIRNLDPAKHSIFHLDARGKVSSTKAYVVRKTGRKPVCLVFINAPNDRSGCDIMCTEDHPICVDANAAKFVPARDLAKGDSVVLCFRDQLVMGSVGAVSINSASPQDVYDIQVNAPCWKGEGNFFANGVMVHNCVFSSIEMAARYQGLEQLRGYRDWWASVSRGGGWPDQVDKSLKKWFEYKKIEPVPYQQYEGKNPEEIMQLIDRTGRMACITYGTSPRYQNKQIAHMVCSPGYRGKYAVVLDNNFVATKKGEQWDDKIYEWMPQAELVRRMKLGSGSAWVFVWLTPPPPPTPRN